MKTNEQLKPGQELDRLVAEKMGWRDDGSGLGMFYPPDSEIASRTITEIPQYSTDIDAAWQVVEFVKEAFGAESEISDNRFDNRWMARFKFYAPKLHAIIGIGLTAPHAICLAFLSIPADSPDRAQSPTRPGTDIGR